MRRLRYIERYTPDKMLSLVALLARGPRLRIATLKISVKSPKKTDLLTILPESEARPPSTSRNPEREYLRHRTSQDSPQLTWDVTSIHVFSSE